MVIDDILAIPIKTHEKTAITHGMLKEMQPQFAAAHCSDFGEWCAGGLVCFRHRILFLAPWIP
jgi:hypothetical protein